MSKAHALQAQPTVPWSPGDLTLIAPSEVVSLDFLDILKKDVLVAKCQNSGFIWARITKDKMVETVIKTLKTYFLTFDGPPRVISDGGPAFGHQFTNFLESYPLCQE